jgi:1-acyl-sn-glycerol-3-phosphate acyltransferase
MYTHKTYKDADYTYFLGPNYKNKMSKKTTSTVIANHVSWLDGMVFGRHFMPSFAPKAGLKHVPLVNVMADAVGSLYIPRGGTREEKDGILNLIKERQELIEESNDTLPPLLIFPEGTTNNG